MAAFLTVRHLSKSYSGVQALQGVDMDVNEGELLGLVGPNGSGKTTLFNCLTGFARPNGGRILWRGVDITSLAPDQIARRGLVRTFQQKMVFPHTTVRENLEMAWQGQRTDGNHQAFGGCDEILRFLGLTAEQDTLAADIPFGFARKLGVGLALAAHPRLLLLDEPAAGLNVEETRELGNLIRSITSELGVTVWVIEHDMALIMSISKRIIVLHAGRKIAEGRPEEIANDPDVITVYLGEKFAKSRSAQ
jgi:ABC-type branched-subunit amino acid transport system ATPase component